MSTLKRVLALSMALVMVLSLGVFAAEYKDQDEIVESNLEAIDMLVALNILNADGYGDGNFHPNDTITRAQAAKMIYVICNGGVDDLAAAYVKADGTFGDVNAGAWYEGYIEYCAAVGIVAGRTAATATAKALFAPEAPVTGYELAKMLLVVADYRPLVQGYEGAEWQNNVLRDARNAELLEGYDVLMSAPAPRQWAAKMMGTLVTEVMMAQYIGDLLVTGSGVEDFSKSVGYAKLKLGFMEGILGQTKSAILGDGMSDPANNYAKVYGNNTYDVNYDISNALLGQEIRVIVKVKNNDLQAPARYNPNNVTVLSVYPTGNTIVTDYSMDKFKVSASDNLDGNNDKWTTGAVKNGNNDYLTFTVDGKIFDFQFKADTTNNYTNFNNFVSMFILNDYDMAPLGIGSSALNEAELHTFIGTVTAFFKNRVDAVQLVNYNGGPDYDFFFVAETAYGRVTSINSSRMSVNSVNVNEPLESFNFTNGTPERNDIVAVTENYTTGECIYDVRIIEATTATVTGYTGSPSAATTVTIDGDKYGKVNDSLAVGGFTLNKNHKTFYIDGGYIVYSTDAISATGGAAPEDVAILVDIGTPVKNNWGATLEVKYKGLDGTTVTAKYDAFSTDSATTGAIAKMTADPVVDNQVGQLATAKTSLDDYLAGDATQIEKLLKVVKTDNGVVFFEIDNDTYSELKFYPNDGVDHTVGFDSTNKIMAITGQGSYDVSENATIFAAHTGDTKYTTVKVSALGSFMANKGYVIQGVLVDNRNEVVAAYINFNAATEVPGDKARDTYLVISGDAWFGASNDKVYTTVTLADGTTPEVRIAKITDINGVNDVVDVDLVNSYKLRLVKYTINSSGYYELTALNAVPTQITEETEDGFRTSNSRYLMDDKSTFFVVTGGAVSVQNEIFYGGDNSTAVFGKTVGDNFIPTVDAAIVNNDGKNVKDNNLTPKSDTTKPVLVSAELNVAKTALTLIFSEELDGTTALADWTISFADGSGAVAGAATAVASVTGDKIVFTLGTPAAVATTKVSVAHTVPQTGSPLVDDPTLFDKAGNALASFGAKVLTGDDFAILVPTP